MKLNFKPLYPYILTLLVILIFTHIANEVIEKETYNLDLSINAWVMGLRTSLWTQVMKIVSDIGVFGGTFVVGFIVANLGFHKKYKLMFELSGISIFATSFVYFLKLMIARQRPDLVMRLVTENTFSFPSGHATTSFIAFPILAILVFQNPRVPIVLKYIITTTLCIFPFVVSFSRLYLGVHYFTDVLAGAIIGISCTCGFYIINSRYKYE